MGFIVIGLNHRTAPIEVRERFALSASEFTEALRRLRETSGMSEGLVLSTCNRVEVYAHMDESVDGPAVARNFLSGVCSSSVTELTPYLYQYEETEAIRHVIRVGAGLDAMVLGETQVFGQMKEAFATASAEGNAGSVLGGLFPRVFKIVKRIHTETGIGHMPGSVSSVAVDLAEKIFGSLAGRTIMIVGAGKMSELTGRSLASRGAARLFVANRTFDHAVELAKLVGGTAVPMEELFARLSEADILISSATSSSWILRRQELAELMPKRRYKPLFIIDIAIPRNVEPEAERVEGVYLYNIDDLRGIAEKYMQERQRYVGRAEAIVAEGVQEMVGWLSGLTVSPLIAELQRVAETARQEELNKLFLRMPDLSPDDREELERFSKAMVTRILRGPILRLKERAEAGSPEDIIAKIRQAFALELGKSSSS